MTRKRIVEDIVLNPARFYRQPVDVLRDRRFDDRERIRILDAWAEAADDGDLVLREKIEQARVEMARKTTSEPFRPSAGHSH